MEVDLLAGLFFGWYIPYGRRARRAPATPLRAPGSPRKISQGPGLAFHWAAKWEKNVGRAAPASIK
jgi:hypothetical protein